MADRTTFHARVHATDLPDGYDRAIRELLAFDGDVDHDAELADLQVDEVYIGAAFDAADWLLDLIRNGRPADPLDEDQPALAPLEFAFDVWQEPNYGLLGRVFRYRPGHALYSASCDNDGKPLISYDAVSDAVEGASMSPTKALKAVRAAFGEF
jgi:hypothetical protein